MYKQKVTKTVLKKHCSQADMIKCITQTNIVSVPKGFETFHSPSVRKYIPLHLSKATMKRILSLAQTTKSKMVDSDCSWLYSKLNYHLQLKDLFKMSFCFTINKAEPTVNSTEKKIMSGILTRSFSLEIKSPWRCLCYTFLISM